MPQARAVLAFPLLSLLLAGTSPVAAQVASRVADLAADSPSYGDSSPQSFFSAAGKLFFSAFEESTGQELYATDGTAAGTELLADLCPGSCGSSPSPLAEVGGALVFSASPDGSTTKTLWRSDGTPAGTYALTDSQGKPLLLPDLARPSFASFGGRLYVTAYGDGVPTVWRTDGTRAGTAALPSLAPALPAQLSAAVVVAGRLFLVGSPPYPAAASLWTSDGTAAGTREVIALTVTPRFPTAVGGHLFFLDAATGQVWASDGTATGTRQVSAFPRSHPLGDDSGFPFLPSPLRGVGDRLYFVADDVLHGQEIWTSDGTPAGTRRVTEFGYDAPFDSAHSPLPLALLGNRLLFQAYDGLTHLKLWTSDGTPETTAQLADVEVDGYQGFATVGGKVIFVEVPSGATGHRLWATYGTAAGTALVTGCPGPCTTTFQLTSFGDAGNTAYFVQGGALWRLEATALGGVVPRRLTDPGRLDPGGS